MTPPAPDPRLDRLRMIARGLDSAVGIPGTRMRMGLDPILGLIPGLGDLTGAALSSYIVLTGIRLGAPNAVVVRMIANVAIDTVAGTLPVLGDLFDAGWKSNSRNVALLEHHLAGPGTRRVGSPVVLAGVAVLLVLLAIGGAALTFVALRAIVRLFQS